MEITDIAGLGKLIRDRRKELDLTQDELAAFVGVGRRMIIELEAGSRDLRTSSALAILGALGLEIEIRPRTLG